MSIQDVGHRPTSFMGDASKNLWTWKYRCSKQTCGHSGRKEGVRQIERVVLKHAATCKIDRQQEFARTQGAQPTLSDNLEEWDGLGWGVGVGELKRERTYVIPGLIHLNVWQKPTQCCEAIILQLKILKNF